MSRPCDKVLSLLSDLSCALAELDSIVEKVEVGELVLSVSVVHQFTDLLNEAQDALWHLTDIVGEEDSHPQSQLDYSLVHSEESDHSQDDLEGSRPV